MDQDATWHEGRPRPRPQCYMETQPPVFGRCLLWPNGRPSQLLLSTCQARQDRQLIMESFQAVDHIVSNKDCFCPVFVLDGRHYLKKISNLCSFMWSSYAWNDVFRLTTTTSTASLLLLFYGYYTRTTCVSRELQLRTGGFCWSKVRLPCWRQLGLLYGIQIREKTPLLIGVTCTVSVPVSRLTVHQKHLAVVFLLSESEPLLVENYWHWTSLRHLQSFHQFCNRVAFLGHLKDSVVIQALSVSWFFLQSIQSISLHNFSIPHSRSVCIMFFPLRVLGTIFITTLCLVLTLFHNSEGIILSFCPSQSLISSSCPPI